MHDEVGQSIMDILVQTGKITQEDILKVTSKKMGLNLLI